MQNRTLEPTGLAKHGTTRGLKGTGLGVARQDSPGRVAGWFWNQTDPFLRAKPGPLAGYPDPLLTLLAGNSSHRKVKRINTVGNESIDYIDGQ